MLWQIQVQGWEIGIGENNEKQNRPSSRKRQDPIIAIFQRGGWKELSSQTAGDLLLPQKEK